MEKIILYALEYSFKAGILIGMVVAFAMMLISAGIAECLK